MSPQEFMVALRMWLGIPVFPSPPSSVRRLCGTVINPHRDRVLGYGHGSLRNKRNMTHFVTSFSTQLLLTTVTARRSNGATATTMPDQGMCFILTSCRAELRILM